VTDDSGQSRKSVTFKQKSRSRSPGTAGHVQTESGVTLPRNTHWGSARPFCVGWYAVSDGQMRQFPRGALVMYREWYGMREGQPNVGLKLTAEQVADGIRKLDIEKTAMGVLDPSAFAEDGGPSIASRMAPLTWRRADNKRVSQAGAIGGWDQLRQRLIGEDGKPMLYFFSTCVHTIRTLPMLQHDESKPEDIDSNSEDHAVDSLRYACMSRPWIGTAASKALEPKDSWARLFDEEPARDWRTR
jgi:hypothetical protein